MGKDNGNKNMKVIVLENYDTKFGVRQNEVIEEIDTRFYAIDEEGNLIYCDSATGKLTICENSLYEENGEGEWELVDTNVVLAECEFTTWSEDEE